MSTKIGLAMDQLERELEIINLDSQIMFVGGSSGYTWGLGLDGTLYYMEPGSDTWTQWAPLDAVTITPQNYSGSSLYPTFSEWYQNGQYSYNTYNPYTNNFQGNGMDYPPGGGPGAYGSSGYNGSNGSWVNVGADRYVLQVNGGTLDEVTITPNSYNGSDVVGLMLNSFGMAADHADVAAATLKLEAHLGFQIASKAFGSVSAGSNLYEFFQDGDWQDLGQFALGAGLMVPGVNGGVVIVGGVVLFAWEIYEILKEHP